MIEKLFRDKQENKGNLEITAPWAPGFFLWKDKDPAEMFFASIHWV